MTTKDPLSLPILYGIVGFCAGVTCALLIVAVLTKGGL